MHNEVRAQIDGFLQNSAYLFERVDAPLPQIHRTISSEGEKQKIEFLVDSFAQHRDGIAISLKVRPHGEDTEVESVRLLYSWERVRDDVTKMLTEELQRFLS